MPSGDYPASPSADTDARQLDVNILKEIAKRELVDALNSVGRPATYLTH